MLTNFYRRFHNDQEFLEIILISIAIGRWKFICCPITYMPWQHQWQNIWLKLSPLNHPSGRKWGMVYGSDRSPWRSLCYVMHAGSNLLKRWRSARVTHPPLQLSYTCLCESWRLWCLPSERSPAWTSHPRWPTPADWWLRLQVDT